MASSVIHMCVASELNKKLKRNNDMLLIGSIAPDIAKHLGRTKVESHFLVNDEIPDLQAFLSKYQKNLKDDFVLGYYIHLYTDYIWFKYFFTDFVKEDNLYLLDGTIIKGNENLYIKYFYNDYTTLNKVLIDDYNLSLKIFETKISKMKNIIKEIPMNDIQIIIDKTYSIIKKSNEKKNYVFNSEKIKKFITMCVDAIISDLENIGYTKKLD